MLPRKVRHDTAEEKIQAHRDAAEFSWGDVGMYKTDSRFSLASSGVRIARYQHCVFRVLHPQLFALSEGELQLL